MLKPPLVFGGFRLLFKYKENELFDCCGWGLNTEEFEKDVAATGAVDEAEVEAGG